MRRLLAIAILAALPAAAQIHGVPPSVTSITPGRNAPGVPASVTSLGPNGFGNRWNSGGGPNGLGNRWSSGGVPVGAVHHHDFHHRRVVPVFVPYYSYPYYSASAESASNEYEDAEERPRDQYSRDEDRYGEHYTDSREEERRRRRAEEERQAEEERAKDAQKAESKAEAKPEAKLEDQEPATVLVFKDGHHQDVSGYAISGDVLYDLGHGRAKKVLLADLDLPATIKLNDELGNDFRLPSRPPKQN